MTLRGLYNSFNYNVLISISTCDLNRVPQAGRNRNVSTFQLPRRSFALKCFRRCANSCVFRKKISPFGLLFQLNFNYEPFRPNNYFKLRCFRICKIKLRVFWLADLLKENKRAL